MSSRVRRPADGGSADVGYGPSSPNSKSRRRSVPWVFIGLVALFATPALVWGFAFMAHGSSGAPSPGSGVTPPLTFSRGNEDAQQRRAHIRGAQV
jgi:hypothetical protein